jgi:hypothetical protein
MKKWSSISIDPALPEKWKGPHQTVRGLVGCGCTLETFMHTPPDQHEVVTGRARHLVLLCVHSHARFLGAASLPHIRSRYRNIPTTLVSLPCCSKFRHVGDIGRQPDVKFEDDCVFSSCRTVEVWNFSDGAIQFSTNT